MCITNTAIDIQREGIVPGREPTIGVIVTTFNHARFLADAISSVRGQTRAADEIIVVDDGSRNDPVSLIAEFPNMRMVRQESRSLASARNTGLRNCATDYVVFLDADDRLLPHALEAGLACAARRPDCAFVYGGFHVISEDGQVLGDGRYTPLTGDPHLALLRGNPISMHATVLYRRDRVMEVGGFDETLRQCEDYDIYLRIAQRYPICCHRTIVAEYRKHGQNMSADVRSMLRAGMAVLDLHEKRIVVGAAEQAALRDGKTAWRNHCASKMLEAVRVGWRERHAVATTVTGLILAARWSPSTFTRYLGYFLRGRARRVLPATVVLWIQRLLGQPAWFPLRSVRFGDLKRSSPISRTFGFDRGTPVDRYYIERFLAENAGDVRGRVLEVGGDDYTLRFGNTRVERSDILHVDATNSRATFVGDLARLDVLPPRTFDCIVLTQTLHLVFDMRAAVATLHRALKSGGVLLMTTPGISPIDRGEWEKAWYWSLTGPAVRSLLAERFRPGDIAVETHGNVFAATAFLYGLALEELKQADLDVKDESFPVIIAARAVRAANA
jgi:glycosyltransferase involved in cell wall biosynthesis